MFPWLGPCLFLSFVIISMMPTQLLVAACEPKRCGNVSVSAPFGVVSGSEENRCAQLGFQVHCTDGVPYLGYYQPAFGLQILDIFYNNGSLLVSDVHKLSDFDLSGDGTRCHVPVANTATKVGLPFLISPLNQNLVFYNCTKVPAGQAGLVETVCRNNTFVRVGGRYNWTGGINSGYTLEGCSATVVPVLGASGEVNASDYKELISDGFLLTWQSPSAGSGKLIHPRQSSNTSWQQLGARQYISAHDWTLRRDNFDHLDDQNRLPLA
jgi:hypothetical protein